MDLPAQIEAFESALRALDFEALLRSVDWAGEADATFSREERHKVAGLRARAMSELAERSLVSQADLEQAHRTAVRAVDESPTSSAAQRASARFALSWHVESVEEREVLAVAAIALLSLPACESYMLLHVVALHGASMPPARLPYARRAVEVADLKFEDSGYRLTARLVLGHHLLCVEANEEADEVFESARAIRLKEAGSTTRLDADIASQRAEAAKYLASRRAPTEGG